MTPDDMGRGQGDLRMVEGLQAHDGADDGGSKLRPPGRGLPASGDVCLALPGLCRHNGHVRAQDGQGPPGSSGLGDPQHRQAYPAWPWRRHPPIRSADSPDGMEASRGLAHPSTPYGGVGTSRRDDGRVRFPMGAPADHAGLDSHGQRHVRSPASHRPSIPDGGESDWLLVLPGILAFRIASQLCGDHL